MRKLSVHILLALSLVLPGGPASDVDARAGDADPAVAFAITDIIAALQAVEAEAWWPGFAPDAIPLALFDGRDTYLFNHPRPPAGFAPWAGLADAWRHAGQFEAVRGNRRALLNDVWTATCVPVRQSPVTGRANTPRTIAGIIVHEKFHVFQKLRHPDWRPNDGVLFGYPLDTPDTLARRRLELTALQRAVRAAETAGAVAWAGEYLFRRRERLDCMPPPFAVYEQELQRFEGIAEYLEYRTGGKDMMSAPQITGFAPGAVREMGYQSGRWLAVLLDRLRPGWKEKMETGEAKYLDELLAGTLPPEPADRTCFEPAEVDACTRQAETDYRAQEAWRAETRAGLDTAPGWQVEVRAAARPLRLVMFDPFHMDALGEREMLHTRWLKLTGGATLEITDRSCMTFRDESWQITTLLVAGLPEKPTMENRADGVWLEAAGLTGEFRSARVEFLDRRCLIILE